MTNECQAKWHHEGGTKHILKVVGGLTIAAINEFPQCFTITCDNGRGNASNCVRPFGTLSEAKRDAESTLRDFGWRLSMLG